MKNPMIKKQYRVVVSVALEYHVKAETPQEAQAFVENVELPAEYMQDTFDIISITEIKE